MTKAKFTVKAIKELTPDEINRMTVKQLREAVNAGASAANKRVRRLEAQGLSSGYLLRISKKRNSKPFSGKGKNQSQLRKELTNIKKFLNTKSSTVAGAKCIEKNTAEIVGNEYGDLSSSEKRKFWDLYNTIAQSYPHLAYSDSDQLIKKVSDIYADNCEMDLHDLIYKVEVNLKLRVGSTSNEIGEYDVFEDEDDGSGNSFDDFYKQFGF